MQIDRHKQPASEALFLVFKQRLIKFLCTRNCLQQGCYDTNTKTPKSSRGAIACVDPFFAKMGVGKVLAQLGAAQPALSAMCFEAVDAAKCNMLN